MLQLEREAILEAVRRLPPEEQRELAHEILRTAPLPASTPSPARREPPAAPDPRILSAMSLRGIVSTDEPLNDVRLLDETRMERFG